MRLVRVCLLVVFALCPTQIFAQAEFKAPPELKAAYDSINQRSVEAAVTFLSSDQMMGRQTPSRELDIACAYVAARFKAAGLEGLGDDGGFLQTTKVPTTSVPTTGIEFSVDGESKGHFGLLSADAEPLEFSGSVTTITGNEPRNQEYKGPVTFEAAAFAGPRDESNFNRKIARLRRAGATAVLVQVDDEHMLTGAAKRATAPKLVRTRGGIAGPVILVPKMDLSGKVKLNLPKQNGSEASVSNVIAVLKGSDPELSKEAIIITAHLDHIGISGVTGDIINNGADDNATGSTAIVTLADAYGAMKTPPKRSVIFMTFWGEEKGFLGSYHYVKNPTWPLKKTVCNVNIEMIGRPEPGGSEKMWGTGWDKSDLGKLLNEGSQKVGVLTFAHPNLSGEMLFRASDNYPFFEKGIVAHSFSAGSLHDDYHKVSDHVEKLELRHMTRVIQGLFAGTLHLANGATPKLTGRQ